MVAERLDHRIYNVSSGRLVRYREVVAAINAAVPGADIALPEGRNPDRPPDNPLDITRLREDTGFRPSTTSSAPCRTTSTGCGGTIGSHRLVNPWRRAYSRSRANPGGWS